MKSALSRRTFLGGAASAGAALCLPAAKSTAAEKKTAAAATPSRARAATDWPVSDALDEKALLDVLHSGKWGRTAAPKGRVTEFEGVFAERMRAKYCIA